MTMRFIALAVSLGALTIVSPASAQDAAQGPYAVVRAGVALDSDLKFRERDRAAPVTFTETADFKPGFTGELGAGYDLGAFRVEGTIGYSTVKLDGERSGAGYLDDSRLRALNLGIAGYFDIPVSETVMPFVGGGIGASRLDGRLARTVGTPAVTSSFRDKDWGFQWHLDAGVGIKAADRTTIELGARYARTSALRFEGRNGAVADDYRPRLSSTSLMLGIRQGF